MAGWRRAHHSPDSSKPYPRSAPPKHFRDSEDYESTRPNKRRRTQARGQDDAEYDSYRPHNTHPSTEHPPPSNPSDKPSTHSHHDRKNNRSTRIHSIRNLLAHDALPPHVKQEKERELASLLFDQQKDKLKSESSKMITRYHKVRFFERKKAERKVKRLTRQRDALLSADGSGAADGVQGDPSGEEDRMKAERQRQAQLKELHPQIREAEVDLNYTIYSPLNAKYISIFPAGPNSQVFLMPTKKQKLLSKEQKEELEALQDSTVGLTRLSDRAEKPPMWREVEKIMFPAKRERGKRERDTDRVDVDDDFTATETGIQKQLELLREGKLTSHNNNGSNDRELVSGNTRSVAEGRKATSLAKTEKAEKGRKRKPPSGSPAVPTSRGLIPGKEAWMDEDGHIDPADLDSPSDEDVARGVRLGASSSNGNPLRASDSDSDGDGGFFER